MSDINKSTGFKVSSSPKRCYFTKESQIKLILVRTFLPAAIARRSTEKCRFMEQEVREKRRGFCCAAAPFGEEVGGKLICLV